jgi:uncharacterized protein YecE (DUF72 family)
MSGTVRIGTSGWNYPCWRADFYAGTPRTHWLRHCGEHFTGIEVNATFYRLQRESTFAAWREQTPSDFRFAIKGNRYLTHNKKLIDPAEPVLLERQRAAALGDKLAAVIWQLPRQLRKNMPRLVAFADALTQWPEARHAVEFRHASWFDDEVRRCLHRYGIAACMSDAADWPMWDVVTTDLVYVRLHGHTRTYASSYSTVALRRWAARVRGWLAEGWEVHVYFDNDAEGAAPKNALTLLGLVGAGARSTARRLRTVT